MKNISYLLISVLFLATSCKKHENELTDYTASLSVMNAITSYEGSVIKTSIGVGNPIIYSKMPDHLYDITPNFNVLGARGYLLYGLKTNTANKIEVVKTVDTLSPIYRHTIEALPGEIYSLYLSGQSTALDAMLLKEEKLSSILDSTASIRFINLCKNSGEVMINIDGKPRGSEVSSLDYQQITEYKSYAATKKDHIYNFEVRSKATGEILATRYVDLSATETSFRFSHVTLVFRGRLESSNTDIGPGITFMKND